MVAEGRNIVYLKFCSDTSQKRKAADLCNVPLFRLDQLQGRRDPDGILHKTGKVRERKLQVTWRSPGQHKQGYTPPGYWISLETVAASVSGILR